MCVKESGLTAAKHPTRISYGCSIPSMNINIWFGSPSGPDPDYAKYLRLVAMGMPHTSVAATKLVNQLQMIK